MKKLFFLALLLAASAAHAAGYESIAAPWQLGFQTPASPVMERLYSMHNFLLWVITIITIFVLILMVYICLRFNRRANPGRRAKTTQHQAGNPLDGDSDHYPRGHRHPLPAPALFHAKAGG